MKSCHFYRIAQCSSKNSMTLSSFSMTFPWPLLFSMTFQACKMVLLNSMTFHDQRAPWHYFVIFQGSRNVTVSYITVVYNTCCSIKNTAFWLKTLVQLKGVGSVRLWTVHIAENVISLVTSCSVRNVHCASQTSVSSSNFNEYRSRRLSVDRIISTIYTEENSVPTCIPG